MMILVSRYNYVVLISLTVWLWLCVTQSDSTPAVQQRELIEPTLKGMEGGQTQVPFELEDYEREVYNGLSALELDESIHMRNDFLKKPPWWNTEPKDNFPDDHMKPTQEGPEDNKPPAPEDPKNEDGSTPPDDNAPPPSDDNAPPPADFRELPGENFRELLAGNFHPKPPKPHYKHAKYQWVPPWKDSIN